MSIRFASRELVPFIGHFVVLDALVAWAPPDLDPDAGLLGPKGGDVTPGLEGVLLPGSQWVRPSVEVVKRSCTHEQQWIHTSYHSQCP